MPSRALLRPPTGPREVVVFGIDPSTDRTGAAAVRFDSRGAGSLLFVAETEAKSSEKDAITARFARIRQTRAHLEAWLHRPERIDVVAYEDCIFRGGSASAAVPQAIGAYLSLPGFSGLPVIAVNTSAVKAAYGNSLGGKTATRADREEKRRELKRRAVVWANLTFGLRLTEAEDAKADALAVCVAAWRIWSHGQVVAAAKTQKRLRMKTP